jgi:hypothetical protein
MNDFLDFLNALMGHRFKPLGLQVRVSGLAHIELLAIRCETRS